MRRQLVLIPVAAGAAFFMPAAQAHSPVMVSLTSGHDVYSTPHEHGDHVWGYAGNDTIATGDGADNIHGGMGADDLYGGYGNDWLEGGMGPDVLVGGPGYDICVGNSGDDVLLGCEAGL